jgi:energy-coupling factor transporter ATP-binding protein EcfA2
MLDNVTFVAGARAGEPSLTVKPAAVTIFVGANNCGKSLALRELEALLTDQHLHREGLLVLKDARYEPQAASLNALEILQPYFGAEEGNTVTYVNPFKKNGPTIGYDKKIISTLRGNELPRWGHVLGAVDVARLDGPSRLSLVGSQHSGDTLGPPTNHLLRLFQDDTARTALRKAVFEAFGRHLVIDPTNVGVLRIKLSGRPPHDSAEEQALDHRARAFHGAATSIDEFSDGVRAYTGLLAALLSLTARILLIDEPDAFLHPPLARKLGYNIARLAAERGARVFAATHSSEFLMGCIESGADVEIVRLTYSQGIATARHLPARDVSTLAREPLMRSANVMASLFHEGVVVTESDNDRAFYQEINHRLVGAQEGIRSCLFLNAQNKQTVHRIVGPLRRMGIPAAALVDIDVIKEGKTVWSNFLKGGNVPEVTRKGLEVTRAHLVGKFDAAGKDMKKDGVAALGTAEQQACLDLFSQLAAYGLFVVQVGELERWLPSLGIVGKAPEWLIRIFQRLGADPADSSGYVLPAADDVWAFLRAIAAWVANPLRQGMTTD